MEALTFAFLGNFLTKCSIELQFPRNEREVEDINAEIMNVPEQLIGAYLRGAKFHSYQHATRHTPDMH
jgi:hypothetical protein